jgi:hypothetical protein
MKLRYFVIVLSFSVLAFSSCKRNPYRVNTIGINAGIEIKRLEKDLFALNPDQVVTALPSLKKEYGSFLQYFSNVINTGDINDPAFGDFLIRFITDKQNNEVFNYAMKVFPDLNQYQEGLEKAFRHYLHYFPGKPVPKVYTCLTGFNYSIIAADSVLGISLDRYLGAGCEYYPRLGIYSYISARMSPEYILPDCMYGWAASEWVYDSARYSNDNVLSRIIHEGKLKYFEKCMLPDETDEHIFGFTADQLKFCNNNEQQMWEYLVEHDLLFSTDQFMIRKLTEEAPFTSYFTNESPGRAAVWIGFRIIESYMMKNPGVSLESLMHETDIQWILDKAKYNPR